MVDAIIILNRILGNNSNSCSLKNITDEVTKQYWKNYKTL